VTRNGGANVTCDTATDCQVAICQTDGSCAFVDKANGISCDDYAADECNVPRCMSGVCTLVPTPNVVCNSLEPNDCQLARCSAQGQCALVPNNAMVGQACTDNNFGDCADAICDDQGGCVASNKNSGTPCTLADTPVCKADQCDGQGKCIYVPADEGASCEDYRPAEDFNLCHAYTCVEGDCFPVNTAPGSSCTDADLCTTDTCDGEGTCVHTTSQPCDQPPNECWLYPGDCSLESGECTYYPVQSPVQCEPTVVDPNIPEGCTYRCIDGECQLVCENSICGNGIAESGEDCDWAEVPPNPCCNVSCRFEPVGTLCNVSGLDNNTNADDAACYFGECSDTGSCVYTWHYDLDGCGTSSGSNDRGALIGALVTAGILALVIGAVAALMWRRKQKALEKAWLEEFLNSGDNTVANNPAFEGPVEQANPAFGM